MKAKESGAEKWILGRLHVALCYGDFFAPDFFAIPFVLSVARF
jgi:hypothetical protein